MDQILVNETLEGEISDIGLICSASNQLIIGNPLQKITYGSSKGVSVKPMKYREKVSAVKLNCAERFVAFASNSLAIFDLEREIAIRQLHEHDGMISDISWHHESPYQLASVSCDDCTLRTWDVRSHPAQVSVRRSQRPVSHVQYSPDCSFVACSGESITIYDLNAAQCVVNIGCTSYVTEILFNPTECLLASASEDRLVRFWDVDTGECVTQSLPFESIVHKMIFHPDGKYLICTTSQYHSAIVWEPFDLLFQIPKLQFSGFSSNKKFFKTLDLAIHEKNLLQLSTSLNAVPPPSMLSHSTLEDSSKTATVLLNSLSLYDFEKCTVNSYTNVVEIGHTESLSHIPSNFLHLPDSPTKNCQVIQRPHNIVLSNTYNSESSTVSPTSSLCAVDTLPPQCSAQQSTPDGPTEYENFSNGSGEGCDSVVSLTSSNEEENNKISSPKILNSAIMPQLKSRDHRSSLLCHNRSSLCNNIISANSSPISEQNLLNSSLKLQSQDCLNEKISLKQSRSKSCGIAKSSNTEQKSNNVSKQTAGGSMTRRMSATSSAVKSEKKKSENQSSEQIEMSKINEIIRSGEKVRTVVKKRTTDLDKFLNHHSNHSNSYETMVELAAKQDDLRIFVFLLKIYLENPKSYSLSLNIKFLEKIRNLFAHQNTQYLVLALELLEMVVRSFGDSIRHGLAAKNYSLGVDVAAEQRFERCMRCRNALIEVRLNSPFLMDRLNEKHKVTFTTILSQIDSIVDE